jgi:hypothetical protein
MSLQSNLQQAIRSALGCANDFNGDLHAMCDVYGIPMVPISGRLIPAAQKFDASITDATSALNYFLMNPQNACGTLALDFTKTSTLDPRITFSRGSQATLFDSAGALVYAKHNLLQRSQALATLPWFNSGLTSIANDTTDVTDPAGGNNASKLVVAGAAGIVGQDAGTLIANQTYVGSVWLRCASGTVSGSLIVYLGIAPFTNIGTQSITITTTWQRFTVTTSAATAAAYNFQIHNLNGGTVYAYGAQFNLVGMEGGVTSSLATYYPTTTAAYYAPRFDYNPSTLAAQGLLIEEQRTNSIRNNTMQGAVAGTPGTLPTNWAVSNLGTLATAVIGTGTENGITYIDLKISGTTSTTGGQINFEAITATAASVSQTWTHSTYCTLAAGSMTNVTSIGVNIGEYDVGSSFLAQGSQTFTPTAANLNVSRRTLTRTLSNASTAYIRPWIAVNFSSGVAIDITLRIGLPQLEQGAFATSVIPTTTTALTRNADVASMTGTNFSSWYNAVEGTLFVDFQTRNPQIDAVPVTTNDGTNNNRIGFDITSTGFGREVVDSGGSSQALIGTGGLVNGAANKMAAVYKVNDFSIVKNGGSASTDVSGTVPTVTQLSIGSRVSTLYLNSTIRSIRYYPVRLPDSTLQALTA